METHLQAQLCIAMIALRKIHRITSNDPAPGSDDEKDIEQIEAIAGLAIFQIEQMNTDPSPNESPAALEPSREALEEANRYLWPGANVIDSARMLDRFRAEGVEQARDEMRAVLRRIMARIHIGDVDLEWVEDECRRALAPEESHLLDEAVGRGVCG